MKLSQLELVGFRNFKTASINLAHKSLIIGPNDVGKTNLICALRLLLDKTLSVSDVEPKDTDFYVHEATNQITITIKFEEIIEDCLLSTFGRLGAVENGILYIQYQATRDQSGKKDYQFYVGKDLASLQKVESRFWLRHLNLSYVDSSRNLDSYLRKEKRRILEDAKEDRTDEEIANDAAKIGNIKGHLDGINAEIKQLSYIKSSTTEFNDELKKLSTKNDSTEIAFDSGAVDPEKYIEDLELVSKVGERNISAGGDGRNNQIFLAMWSSRIDPQNPAEITIFCIEEPEAHLHPHQQRRLAEYLSTKLAGQVILTTHSPQIACEFSPNSLVKLYYSGKETKVANDGCSEIIEDAFFQFGHRLNIIPAEAFFANVVCLVEGVSEVLFYKALAANLPDIDLDRLNISVISAEGIGFETYIQIFTKLGIPVVVKTDNDYTKVPYSENLYSCSGIKRGVKAAKLLGHNSSFFERVSELHNLTATRFADLAPDMATLALEIITALEAAGVFISNTDLEQDLIKSPLRNFLAQHYSAFGDGDGDVNDVDLLAAMTESKGENMFSFLQRQQSNLTCLSGSKIASPLLECKRLAG